MNTQDEEALRIKYNNARTFLFGLKAGKYNGPERAYGRAYDNMAVAGMVPRLKRKYRGM